MRAGPPSDTTYMYLIRHGSTAANEQRPYVLQGQAADNELSATGRDQARHASGFLSDFTVDLVYASPLKRAVETAQIIAEPHGLDVHRVQDIIEVNVGVWENLDWDTIMQGHAEDYRRFMENPKDNAYSGGESYGDVYRRVQPAFERLLKQHVGRAIVVVAHNVVNRVYLAGLLGLDLAKAKDIQQSNCSVNVIRHREGKTRLLTMNARFHLPE